MLPTLTPSNEDDIPLTDVRIAILQEENLVDAIILERREFDKYAYRASQAFLQNQVLLPTNLASISCGSGGAGRPN